MDSFPKVANRGLSFIGLVSIAWIAAIASTTVSASEEPLFIQADTNILFLGDSITQGGTFIAYIDTYLWMRYPDREYNLINLGLGSETASGLSEPDHPFPRPNIHTRLDRALAKAKPDLTFICYGMNDGIYHPPSEDRFNAYKAGMTRLIEKVRATGSKIILITPPPFDAETRRLKGSVLVDKNAPVFGYKTPYQDYDSVLEGYVKWVLKKRKGVAKSIDIHSPLKSDLARIRMDHSVYEYGDGIHPNNRGHYVIARTILKELNAPGLDSLPDYSALPSNSSIAKAMPLILKRHQLISAAWREHVGHSKPKKESVPPLAEAQSQAKSMEIEIREILTTSSQAQTVVKKMTRPVGDHQLQYFLQSPAGKKPVQFARQPTPNQIRHRQ